MSGLSPATDYRTADRLIEDDARRRQGAFYTPAIWVAEAHKLIGEVLGAGWRDECIVWDPAAGTGNLTRDYVFKDLIISTAEKADVQVIKDQGYASGPGAEVFQLDFLSGPKGSVFFEEGESNLVPEVALTRLKKAASEGRRLVFLMNPPYGTANDAGAKGTSKAGVALTETNRVMKAAKLGACSQQLYAQFMFRCATTARDLGFKEYTVAEFSKPTFMCSGSYRPFREWWYDRHAYQGGFLFQASHFADVSGAWGVAFTVWNSPGKTDGTTTLPMTLKDVEDFTVVGTGTKAVYNSDGRDASTWIGSSGSSKNDSPKFSSGLKVPATETYSAGSVVGTLGVLCNMGNNLMKSGTDVFFLSGKPTHKGHCHTDLLPTNFRRGIALFAARKLVTGDWVNDKDEYLAPNVTTPSYEQWVDDAHVYALPHPSNNCTSMRSVPYRGKLWTIHNHFFWRTHKATLAALDTESTPTLYADCKVHPSKDVFGNDVVSTPDPYLASVLPKLNLSPEAREVLTRLDDLWVKSLFDREAYAAGKPELHLMTWDAGVYQLKHLFRDLYPTEWKALQVSFKKLGERLRPGVYEYGFLRK